MNPACYALGYLASKARAFERMTKDPMAAQKAALFEFIARNKNTVYGKEHSFKDIRTIEDYQRSVPVNTYEMLRPYIDRLINGEKNILTKEPPVFFGTTSGTTGTPKFIPVTKYSRRKKAEVMNVWAYRLIRDHPFIFDGKILAIVSPEHEKCTPTGLPCGAETGHAYKNLPYLVRRFYALPYSVFEISDYEAKYYCILRLSMGQNITTIATMNPSTIVLLCQKIEGFKESIIEDIKRGTLKKDMNIKEDIRKAIEKNLRPDPDRAAFLKKLLFERKELLPRDFWPGLKLIECWKGGTVGMYLGEFPKYFGDIAVRDFGYLSSEARCSVPMDDDKCCGVLAVKANFYEFIPREERNNEGAKTLLCDRLEAGGEYFIIITTPGGLYRYDIDDVIKVTGFYNKTPRIEFVQKGLNVTSVTGEKLYESQVAEAVEKATSKTGVTMEAFSACIQWDRIPRYVFLVELKESHSYARKKELLKFIDEEISALNAEYETKRKSQRLDLPILKIVKRGGFQKYRIKRVESGTHDGQYKIPLLTKDLAFQGHFDIEEEVRLDR